MHRSGTSALTRVLNLAGVDLGQNLLDARADNERGFWEHAEINRIDDALLSALGLSWDSWDDFSMDRLRDPKVARLLVELYETLRGEFSQTPLWAVKDPRLCRLLPLWKALLAKLDTAPFAVIIIRHPFEVAASLLKRDNIDFNIAMALWSKYLLDCEQGTRHIPRVIVTYDELLDDWRGALEKITATLRLAIPNPIGQAQSEIESFLSNDLRHHRTNKAPEYADMGLATLALRLYELMLEGAGHIDRLNLDAMDECHGGFAEAVSVLRAFTQPPLSLDKSTGSSDMREDYIHAELSKLDGATSQQPVSSNADKNPSAEMQSTGFAEETQRPNTTALPPKQSPKTHSGGVNSNTAMERAIALFNDGRWEAARTAFNEIRQREPDAPQVLFYLGAVALSAKARDEAKAWFARAVKLSADKSNTQAAIGQQCLALGELELAEAYLTAAIQTRPDLTGAYALLGEALQGQGRHEEALTLLDGYANRAGQMFPEILSRMLRVADELGDLEISCSLGLLASQYPDRHALAISLMPWCDAIDASALRDQALEFSTAHCQAATPPRPMALGKRSRLRIGFVLDDLACDALRARLHPLLAHLDPRRFETLLFIKSRTISDDVLQGEFLQRCLLLADHCLLSSTLDAGATRQLIQENAIDILVNLERHGGLAALEPFVQRTAPIQLNWSDPPLTSGLMQIDAIFRGHWPSFLEKPDAPFTEEIHYLPHYHAAYAFPQGAPRLPRRDADTAPFTFGCLVPIQWVSLHTWKAWTEILRRAPDSRLLINLAGLGEAARRHALGKLPGVGEERLLWVSADNATTCCDAWREVNLGLCPLAGDSVYSTLLGVWMGVASIARTSPTPWGRLPALALQQVGLEDFVADSAEAYIERGVEQAHRRDALKTLGSGLRERLRQSPFCDTQGFAEHFGDALEALWLKRGGRLEGKP